MKATTNLTALEIAYLAWQYREQDPGPCRVCGAEMTIAAMGGGRPTVYVCSSPEAQWLAAGKSSAEREQARQHYARSEREVPASGDHRVRELVATLRSYMEAAGERPEPEIGDVYRPWEGSSIGYRYLGGDRFEEILDDE